jgi:hypothetical protein
MTSCVRGLLIFSAAFLIGSAIVPPQSVLLDVPPVTVELPLVTATDHSHTTETGTLPSQPESFTIEIRRHDPAFGIEERFITPVPDGSKETNIDLDLTETIENQIIQLHRPDSQKPTYKIEQQFETSMALGDEGPHFDLDDWKHYTSPWKEIEPVAYGRFITSKLSETDYFRFPKVTGRHIVDALKKRNAGKRWLNLARQTCSNANSGACYVSVSRISLRISVKEGSRWTPIHTLNFFIPTGCWFSTRLPARVDESQRWGPIRSIRILIKPCVGTPVSS